MSLLRIGRDGPIKICPACKDYALGLASINEMFNRDASRRDGYRTYCKRCRRSRRLSGKGR